MDFFYKDVLVPNGLFFDHILSQGFPGLVKQKIYQMFKEMYEKVMQ